MPSNNSNKGFGLSHLSGLPVTVAFAVVVALALIILALLRHFSVKVEA